MNHVIEGSGAQVYPDEKYQYRNKGDVPFKMICGVLKEFEWDCVCSHFDEPFISKQIGSLQNQSCING